MFKFQCENADSAEPSVITERCAPLPNRKNEEIRRRIARIKALNPGLDSEWHEVIQPDEDEELPEFDSCQAFVSAVETYGNRETMHEAKDSADETA